jgi:hypothetical protein
MPRKCKHENVTGRAWSKAYPRWYAEFKSTKELPAIADALVCNSCGAWLPLGPSDETDERVAVEIRAAHIAATHRGLSSSIDLTAGEHFGWMGDETADIMVYRDGEPQLDEGVPLNLESPNWLAGHLARVIATHGDEQ